MKAILTLFVVLFIGAAAQAQSAVVEIKEVKVETIEMGIVTFSQPKEVALEKNTEVTRLYKFRNSRIKKALKFTTRRDRAKMA